MEPESAKPASGPSAAAGGASGDITDRPRDEPETIASSISSFRGLVGGTGSSSGGSPSDETQAGKHSSSHTFIIGQTMGRYQIRKLLGSGSMGSVFLAHDTQLDRP